MYVYDVQARATEFVRDIGDGTPAFRIRMNGDGSSIAADAGKALLIDRVTGTTESVGVAPGGGFDGNSRFASVSDDARFVAFEALNDYLPGDNNNFGDILLRDTEALPPRRLLRERRPT